jgi:recombination protein RecT
MVSIVAASWAGDVVYEGDEFSFEYGSAQHLKHRPKGKRVNPVYAYCHATLTDGEAFVVLPWDQIIAIRDASQGYRTAIQYGKAPGMTLIASRLAPMSGM